MTNYDLIVIGGGSGGLAAAQRAAEYGARVTVIERGPLGGTCVNVGCVPKKIMWNAAMLAGALADARDYGFDVSDSITHDWAVLKRLRDAFVRQLNGIYERNLATREIELRRSDARLTGPGQVTMGADTITAPHVIIATGALPSVPGVGGADLGITSDGFFALEQRPQRAAVVGGGYVAVELAGILAALGSQVTMLVRQDHLLAPFDELLQLAASEGLTNAGVRIHWRCQATGLEGHAPALHIAAGKSAPHGPFDAVIWAVGRVAQVAGLGLEAAGVALNARGFVDTNIRQETNVPGIYALGDVAGRAALTPVAIAAGRRLADRLFGGMSARHLDYRDIPTVIFAHPPIASFGLSERDAYSTFGDSVRVYQTSFVPLYHALTAHQPRARMKLVTVGEDERVVGCHIAGPGADEILQGVAIAIRMGARKRDFDETVGIHPTVAEELLTMRQK